MLSILTNNNHLYNYYELFEIINTSSAKQIIKAYQNKIMNYNNENLSQIQINEIKILKMGLYILITPDLRIIYDYLLNDQLKCNQENNEKISISPAELGDTQEGSSFKTEYAEENSLDALFNIDNTWMNKHVNNKYNKKTDSEDVNLIGDRIFSLSNLNKKPGYSTNHEIDLRKPLQCRLEKES